MTKKSVSRVVALEEAFLHPRVWDLFPELLQQKYKVVKARLTDVGPERIRLMDAAGIDVQVLSHVQPGIQMRSGEASHRPFLPLFCPSRDLIDVASTASRRATVGDVRSERLLVVVSRSGV